MAPAQVGFPGARLAARLQTRAKRQGQWTREVVVDEVPMMTGRTVFMVVGNWFGWTAFALLLVGMGQAFWNVRQRRPPRDEKALPPPRPSAGTAKGRRSKKRKQG